MTTDDLLGRIDAELAQAGQHHLDDALAAIIGPPGWIPDDHTNALTDIYIRAQLGRPVSAEEFDADARSQVESDREHRAAVAWRRRVDHLTPAFVVLHHAMSGAIGEVTHFSVSLDGSVQQHQPLGRAGICPEMFDPPHPRLTAARRRAINRDQARTRRRAARRRTTTPAPPPAPRGWLRIDPAYWSTPRHLRRDELLAQLTRDPRAIIRMAHA